MSLPLLHSLCPATDSRCFEITRNSLLLFPLPRFCLSICLSSLLSLELQLHLCFYDVEHHNFFCFANTGYEQGMKTMWISLAFNFHTLQHAHTLTPFSTTNGFKVRVVCYPDTCGCQHQALTSICCLFIRIHNLYLSLSRHLNIST